MQSAAEQRLMAGLTHGSVGLGTQDPSQPVLPPPPPPRVDTTTKLPQDSITSRISTDTGVGEAPSSATATATDDCSDDDSRDNNREEDYDDDDDDLAGFYADIGFLFEGSQPTQLKKFEWVLSPRKTILVAIHAVDDEPGAVQSGHYLWPAAKYLADYLVQCVAGCQIPPSISPSQHSTLSHTSPSASPVSQGRRLKQYSNRSLQSAADFAAAATSMITSPTTPTRESESTAVFRYPALLPDIRSILELGAGCALASLTALQLWRRSLQCVTVTDHDPGTLERARDNHESTVEEMINAAAADATESGEEQEEALNYVINSVANIPVVFENLSWGHVATTGDVVCDEAALQQCQDVLAEHVTPCSNNNIHNSATSTTTTTNSSRASSEYFYDVILGSDLIYDVTVVEPLLTTAARLMRGSSPINIPLYDSFEETAAVENPNESEALLSSSLRSVTSSLHSTTSPRTTQRALVAAAPLPPSVFLLSQSFVYDAATEQELERVCTKLGLTRTILKDENGDGGLGNACLRIQQFTKA